MCFEEYFILVSHILEETGVLICRKVDHFHHQVNAILKPLEPLHIFILGALVAISLIKLRKFLFPDEGFQNHTKSFYWIIRCLPIIKSIIAKNIDTLAKSLEEELRKDFAGLVFYEKLPNEGIKKDDIIKEVEQYQQHGNIHWREGRVSGAVYRGNDPVLDELVTEVYGLTAYTNPLHFDVFPGVCKMEAEVVRMIATLFHGGPNACGTVTTGGTESILMACKAYRDLAYHEKGITKPEMVIPVTAHAAFDKGAQLFNILVRHVPVNKSSMKVNPKDMKKAITKNTIMLVGSCPQFPHGIIDPIPEIAQLGEDYSIPVHVDCCLGGLLVPFMREAGCSIPLMDFSLPGVTSISCDTHKYGYAPKGSSVVVYRDLKYRHYQFSVQPNWPGGIYGTPTILGSRAGGTIAATWATMLYTGYSGYLDSCKKILATTQYITKGLRQIEGIFVLGDPEVSVIAVSSDKFDIYRLCDALGKGNWSVNMIQYPKGFHFCVTLQHTAPGVADDFLGAVNAATAEILLNPNAPATGNAAMYGTAQKIPDKSIVTELTWAFLDACYSTKKVPKQ